MAINADTPTASPLGERDAPQQRFPLPARTLLLLIAIVAGAIGNLWNILAGYNGDDISLSWITAHQSAWAGATYGNALFGTGIIALLLAVCVLVRERGAAWATASLAAGVLGTGLWLVSAAVPMQALALHGQTVVSPAAAQSLITYIGHHDVIQTSVAFPAFLLLLITQIAVTVALIRSRTIPLWVPILFVAGMVVETVFGSGGALTAICNVPQITAMIAIGWYAHRKATA